MKPTEEEVQLVRHFAENSVKFLMRNPENAREGLTMMAPEHVRLIDFARMTVMPTTFIAPDFRHQETDLLLKAPMRGARGKGESPVYVYQLIEHQSEPDRLAVFRANQYVTQVFQVQVREWQQGHGHLRDVRFDPVLPVVIYTGTRTWDALTPMHELVKHGDRFVRQTPSLEPVFFNLATTPAKRLHDEAGLFGRVLHLLQQRRAKGKDFRMLLGQVVEHVEGLPASQRGRWHDLLWYLQAMVYHVREEQEHEPLVELVRETERAKARQAEVSDMGKTMAEVLVERGMKEGLQQGELNGKRNALLSQMRQRFGKVPPGIEKQILGTKEEAKLDQWLGQILTAKVLTDMSLSAEP